MRATSTGIASGMSSVSGWFYLLLCRDDGPPSCYTDQSSEFRWEHDINRCINVKSSTTIPNPP